MTHNPNLPLPAAVIPHRPPSLWLDGVIEAEAGVSAQGFWTPGPEHFDGHFPEMPLLMGVKQVESLAQLGAYVVMLGSEKPVVPTFRGIESVRFSSAVRPEKTLALAISIVDRGRRDFKGEGTVSVDGEETCKAVIIGDILPEKVALRLFGVKNA